MRGPLVLLTALVGTGLLAVTLGMTLGVNDGVTDVRFDQGKTTSKLFYPPATRHEDRIERHPHADGSADDDVWMRDGSTKHIVYDKNMTLRQVFAYFKGANPASPEEKGPLMYEKAHDANGHLTVERHLRLDGSLEMDGHLGADRIYVRHKYYPGASNDPARLVVQTEQTFDMAFKPVSQTDFRPDSTRQLVHTWEKDGREVVAGYAGDGVALVWSEATKDGHYDRKDYLPDGVTLALETLNDYSGTTVKWFRPDNTVRLTVQYTNLSHHVITYHDNSGTPVVMAEFEPDYTATAVKDVYPMMVDHIDHFNGAGKFDVRYVWFYKKGLAMVIEFDEPGEMFGARSVYTIGEDGWATKVEKYDTHNKSLGAKELTRANSRQFAIEPYTKEPPYEMPKIKDGLKLYGDPPTGPY